MKEVSFYFITGWAQDHGKDSPHYFHLHIHGLDADAHHVIATDLEEGIQKLKDKALIEMALTQKTPQAETFANMAKLWGSSDVRLVIPILSYEPIYQLAEFIKMTQESKQ